MNRRDFIKIGLVVASVLCLMTAAEAKEVKVKDMSVTVNIYYTGENGNARKFVKEMEESGTAAAIRAEDGNIKYEYFYPANDEETVLLIDKWKNQAAIDAHHATPMMGKITELRNKYDLKMQVERYTEDKGGIPDKDEKFIRK